MRADDDAQTLVWPAVDQEAISLSNSELVEDSPRFALRRRDPSFEGDLIVSKAKASDFKKWLNL